MSLKLVEHMSCYIILYRAICQGISVLAHCNANLIDIKINVENQKHPMPFPLMVYNIMAVVLEGEIVWLNSGHAILAVLSCLRRSIYHINASP